MLIGYARVSAHDQDTTIQINALHAIGCTTIYEEKASGATRTARFQLQACLDALQPGDVLVVYKVDRIARSLTDLLAIVDDLKARNVSIRSLTEPFDNSSPMGLFFVQMLGAFAQLERAMIRERCAAGIAAAKAKGVRLGRPSVISDQAKKTALRMRADGHSLHDIARHLAVTYDAVCSYIARAEGRKK